MPHTPPETPPATLFEQGVSTIVILLPLVVILAMAPQAVQRETQWRTERHCNAYGEQIDRWAERRGTDNPCTQANEEQSQ